MLALITEATMDFQLEQRWVVTRDQNKWILDTKDIQVHEHGETRTFTFMKLEKRHRQLVKFTTGKYLNLKKGSSREFSQSCVDTLITARQSAADQALQDALRSDDEERPKQGRKRKHERQCKPTDLVLISDILNVNVAGERGGRFKVLAEGLGTKLVWLEMSHAALLWLVHHGEAE